MSRNVNAVKEWLRCYNARDIEGLLAVSDPEIEFRSRFAGLEAEGAFKGTEGVHAYFKEIDEAYESFQINPTEYIDAGAGVLLIASAEWCGRGSGAVGELEIWCAFWLVDAKVFRETTYTARTECFAALGLDDPG